MGEIGKLRTEKSIEHAMKEIKVWLDKVGVSGLDLIIQYDARLNVAVIKFKKKGKSYEFRSTKQKNCRLNMHAISKVMEFKVRADIMKIEDFDTSMQAYLAIEDKTGSSLNQPVQANESAYVVLGLSPLCSNEEFLKKHRELMKSYHPDMALSVEAKKVFEKRSAEINEAVSSIKLERGL